MRIDLLSGGAAQGLLAALGPAIAAATGADINGTFGAVGAMRQKLVAGAAADVLILTRDMIAALAAEGHAVAASVRDIGVVHTAVAARAGEPLPLVGTARLLEEALLEAGELHVPDTRQSTAGQHVARVLAELGIAGRLQPRLREHPNGMTAMAALARTDAHQPLGITQVTEIVATTGVTLVRPLPDDLGLATVYTAAVAGRAKDAALARRVIEVVAGQAGRSARAKAGFEPC